MRHRPVARSLPAQGAAHFPGRWTPRKARSMWRVVRPGIRSSPTARRHRAAHRSVHRQPPDLPRGEARATPSLLFGLLLRQLLLEVVDRDTAADEARIVQELAVQRNIGQY